MQVRFRDGRVLTPRGSPVPDLLVFDLSAGPYDDETILRRPLGGTQSGVLETCLSLAADIDLALCNGVAEERRVGRLRFLPSRKVPVAELLGADWVAFVNAIRPELLEALPFRAGRPRLALWAQHDIDQPAVQPLARPSVLRQISRFLFLSDWQ